MTGISSSQQLVQSTESQPYPIMTDFPIFYVLENEDKQIFDPEIVANFFEIASCYLPKAVDFLKTLPPFDFGPRPIELKGLTSMMAVEKNDKDEDYIYLGEIAKYDNKTQCGKGIRVWITGDSPAILIGWFRNGSFTGHGRNIFENSLTYYEGEFFNYKFHGQGTLKQIDKDDYEGQFKSGQRHGFGV